MIRRGCEPAMTLSVHSVLTMLPARFSLLVLLALVSTTSALQAVCEFQGDGTGELEGWLLLNELETPDGTEIT